MPSAFYRRTTRSLASLENLGVERCPLPRLLNAQQISRIEGVVFPGVRTAVGSEILEIEDAGVFASIVAARLVVYHLDVGGLVDLNPIASSRLGCCDGSVPRLRSQHRNYPWPGSVVRCSCYS